MRISSIVSSIGVMSRRRPLSCCGGNYWNEQLKLYPRDRHLIALRESYESARRICHAEISDKGHTLELLEQEMQKLDNAFGPENEAQAQARLNESVDELLEMT